MGATSAISHRWDSGIQQDSARTVTWRYSSGVVMWRSSTAVFLCSPALDTLFLSTSRSQETCLHLRELLFQMCQTAWELSPRFPQQASLRSFSSLVLTSWSSTSQLESQATSARASWAWAHSASPAPSRTVLLDPLGVTGPFTPPLL